MTNLYRLDINHKVLEWFIDYEMLDERASVLTYSGLLLGKKVHRSYMADKDLVKMDVSNKIKSKREQGWLSLEELKINQTDDIIELNAQLIAKLPYDLTYNKLHKVQKAKLFTENTFNYPGIIQKKLNGNRVTLRWAKVTEGEGLFASTVERAILLSMESHELILPHITNGLTEDDFKLIDINGDLIDVVYDGEIYNHGMPLSEYRKRIPMKKSNGTITKASLDSTILDFVVFDLAIPNVKQSSRLIYMKACSIFKAKHIKELESEIIKSDEEAKALAIQYINLGYEGAILRDKDAMYNFGRRVKSMVKIKQWRYTNCTILDVILKNENTIGNNKITYISVVLKNDVNDESFDCSIEGNEAYRKELLENKDSYIGRVARVKYRERSGVINAPFQATIINIE